MIWSLATWASAIGEAYLWCLYALALSGRTRAAVLLPFESLDNAEQARAILLREGLVESVLYHPLAESPMHGMYALIVLSTGNRSVSFRNAATPMPRLRFADGARYPNLPLAFSPDWSGIECDSRKTVSIETVELETRKLLQHHAALSKGRVGLISVAQNYSATLGDSFMRVVPFMPETAPPRMTSTLSRCAAFHLRISATAICCPRMLRKARRSWIPNL